jgi:hypothetical protein
VIVITIEIQITESRNGFADTSLDHDQIYIRVTKIGVKAPTNRKLFTIEHMGVSKTKFVFSRILSLWDGQTRVQTEPLTVSGERGRIYKVLEVLAQPYCPGVTYSLVLRPIYTWGVQCAGWILIFSIFFVAKPIAPTPAVARIE